MHTSTMFQTGICRIQRFCALRRSAWSLQEDNYDDARYQKSAPLRGKRKACMYLEGTGLAADRPLDDVGTLEPDLN